MFPRVFPGNDSFGLYEKGLGEAMKKQKCNYA
jgi:hypothetical protein